MDTSSKVKTEFRTAESRDAEAVTDLCRQLGYDVQVGEIKERIEKVVGSSDTAIILATDGSGKVIGFLQVGRVPLLAEGHRAEIASLVIDQSVRCLGIGKLLVEQAEKWAVERELKTMVVRSKIDRERAHRFYKSFGYYDFKSQHVFRKEL